MSRILIVLCLGIVLASCASNRGRLDVRVQQSPAAAANAVPLKIVAVTDKRVFQINPRQPSIPSLKHGEINNPAITKRAIARKRGGFGMAVGDILLPEGRTVEDVTRETLVKALTKKGYRVLKPGDPGYEDAPALSAEIHQFWSWFTPGFWRMATTL